jgi:mono/diheme cytochrome c family protein
MFKMYMAAGTLTLAVAAAFGSAAAPQAQKPSAAARVQAGEALFNGKCLQCHAVHEGQYSFGPNLSGEMKPPHPKKSAAEIRAILKDGKGKMPAFGDKLTQPDTDALIAYLHTL